MCARALARAVLTCTPSHPRPPLPSPVRQQESLHWMVAQEATAYRGGILADEMGMGKTIQAGLSLRPVSVLRVWIQSEISTASRVPHLQRAWARPYRRVSGGRRGRPPPPLPPPPFLAMRCRVGLCWRGGQRDRTPFAAAPPGARSGLAGPGFEER